MADEKPPFRFLSTDEFMRLDQSSRMSYLVRASEELDARQRTLRAQVSKVVPEKGKKPAG